MKRAASQQGFTLLEVLVALAILAVAAAGLISASSATLRQHDALEKKTIAGWVADNRLVELRTGDSWPEIGRTQTSVAMAERQWYVRSVVAATDAAQMRRIEVDVRLSAATDAPVLITLTGFVGER